MEDLNEIKYTKLGESKNSIEKQLYWNIAFGLQEVDNLYPSKYMIELAKENIKGIKSYEKVDCDIRKYYSQKVKNEINNNEKQADEVSLRYDREF